jgi:hypothetical protein
VRAVGFEPSPAILVNELNGALTAKTRYGT